MMLIKGDSEFLESLGKPGKKNTVMNELRILIVKFEVSVQSQEPNYCQRYRIKY